VESIPVGNARAINKLAWDVKDGRRAALGSSDGKLHIYDIGDMAIPKDTEWVDLQRSLTAMLSNISGGPGLSNETGETRK